MPTSHLEANLNHVRALYQMILSRYALEKAAGAKFGGIGCEARKLENKPSVSRSLQACLILD